MQPPAASSTTRDAVPIPPLNSWQTIPVPPPTLPSSTGPSDAAAIASSTWSVVTWKPSMSLSRPSHVSPTTGSAQYDVPNGSRRTAFRMIPSRTIPTQCVFVIPIGPVRRPASRIHSRPVSSPLPFRRWLPA